MVEGGIAWVQYASLGVVVAALLLIGTRAKHLHRWLDKPRLVWEATWLLHALAFYVVLFLVRDFRLLAFQGFTQWSSILRLHGYLTIFVIEFVELRYSSRRRE